MRYIPQFETGTVSALQNAAATLKNEGATLAEIRVVDQFRERISLYNSEVLRPDLRHSRGYGVRVLANGAWGFACGTDESEAAIADAGRRALALARAAAEVNTLKVELPGRVAPTGEYGTEHKVDPFTISTTDKLALLARATAHLKTPRTSVADGHVTSLRDQKLYVSSDGGLIQQGFIACGAAIGMTAIENGEVFRRSYPADYGAYNQAGFEFVQGLDLETNAVRVRAEMDELVKAPRCPAGRATVIIDGNQLALQIHESTGHPTELDRALGEEQSLAGMSFLTPSAIGRKYGSEKVTLTADSTLAGGMGTFGWDDEGTPAGRLDLVHAGKFAGFLGSRETAARTGLALHGAMRAETFSFIPIVRMTNVNLLPGDAGSLDDLIADTGDGLLIDSNRSWSIDDLRLNFQFGCELAWEIKHGKKTRMFKHPLYTGRTPEFWGNCDAVCGPEHFKLWGVPHCGKGDPMQLMMVGHGCSAARFRDVEIGPRA